MLSQEMQSPPSITQMSHESGPIKDLNSFEAQFEQPDPDISFPEGQLVQISVDSEQLMQLLPRVQSEQTPGDDSK